MSRAAFAVALSLALLLAAAPLGAASRDGGAGVEMVVVFNKGVASDRASAVLEQLGWDFHEGSDSSRGKKYFYSHGPQFLVEVPDAELDRFKRSVKKRSEIFEAYPADRSVQKD
ncbi:MAG TPA: hypothetical protein VFF06_25895 [Polyangia bacterium]|nr:hypothetical protein [Polyangia bacterium]